MRVSLGEVVEHPTKTPGRVAKQTQVRRTVLQVSGAQERGLEVWKRRRG